MYNVQSPESLENMHMGRDIRQMPMNSSRSMPNEFFLDQACCQAEHICYSAGLSLYSWNTLGLPDCVSGPGSKCIGHHIKEG